MRITSPANLLTIGLLCSIGKGKNAEFEFLIKLGEEIIPVDVKKSRGNLVSMNAYANHNKAPIFIKVSSNHFGYDETNQILTMPLYAFFMLAREIQPDQF